MSARTTDPYLPKWILFLGPHWVGIYMVTIKPYKNGSRWSYPNVYSRLNIYEKQVTEKTFPHCPCTLSDAYKLVCSENLLNWMKSDVHYSYSLKSKFSARADFTDLVSKWFCRELLNLEKCKEINSTKR